MSPAFRRIAVHTAYALLYFSGAIRLAYWLGRNRQVIVTYHNVLPDVFLDGSLHGLAAHAEFGFQQAARSHLSPVPRNDRAWTAGQLHCRL